MSCVTQPKGHIPSTFHPVSVPSHPIPSTHHHISHIAGSQITLVVQSLKYISVTLVFVAVAIGQDSLTSWDGKSTSGSDSKNDTQEVPKYLVAAVEYWRCSAAEIKARSAVLVL